MGCSSIKVNDSNSNTNVLWIEQGIEVNELKQKYKFKIEFFKTTGDAMDYIKQIYFNETKIIIDGKLYKEFIKSFNENIKVIYVAPKIIVLTDNKDNFILNNKDYLNNIFYNFGGIATSYDEIREFLADNLKPKVSEKEKEDQLTFEYINSFDKLLLPIFYKVLINKISKNNIEQYTSALYDIYSYNNDIKSLLGSIKSIPNIPIEILSKYYIRLYTIESDFYKNINKDLGLNKTEQYLTFIKVLYEGLNLRSLPVNYDKEGKKIELFRGSKVSKGEIEIIQNNMKNRIKGLPSSIVFSKSFLSFTKERSIAENFYLKPNSKTNLSRVLYIIEKDDNIDYNLATHADIGKISFYPEEEVLFFPFSSFEIKEIKDTKIQGKNGYEIKLLYLGKYLKDIEINNDLIVSEHLIPDSKFKNQICEFGLIEKEKLKSINSKILYELYKNLGKNNKENEILHNIITGEINIGVQDINQDIQIINSYENYLRNSKNMLLEYNIQYENEKEIERNIDIKINGKKIPFSYVYKFENEGKYKIEYIFKKSLSKLCFLFHNCSNLIAINLSNYNAITTEDTSHMFSDCESLINLDLSNCNIQNLTNMTEMFSGCKSIKNLDLSKLNTHKVKDMS